MFLIYLINRRGAYEPVGPAFDTQSKALARADIYVANHPHNRYVVRAAA
jgi:hypothetical protein